MPRTTEPKTSNLLKAIKLSAKAKDRFPELARCLAMACAADKGALQQFIDQSGIPGAALPGVK